MSFQEPNGWKRGLALVGLVVGGALVGGGVAELLAPGASWATGVGWLMLPLSFVIGAAVWKWILVGTVAWRVGRGLLQKSKGKGWWESVQQSVQRPNDDRLPGGFVFTLCSTAIASLVGVATCFAPTARSAPLILIVYAGVGLAFGTIAGRLARMGYVPLFD